MVGAEITSAGHGIQQMKFDVNKCVFIRCSQSPNPVQRNCHLDIHILDVREEHSYLGILLYKFLS